MSYQKKWPSQVEAMRDAEQQSNKTKDTVFYVIESKGEFYAESSDAGTFLRAWETQHGAFCNGKKVNA